MLRERWKANHTYINGRQLKFIGTATGLFFTWLERLVLTIAALGICLFWVMPRLNKWIVEHTGFARPEPQTSGRLLGPVAPHVNTDRTARGVAGS